MITEKPIVTINFEGDSIRLILKTGFYRDSKLVSEELISNRLIQPGDDVSNEPFIVHRIVSAAHVPTLVSKHKAEQKHIAAKQRREQDDTLENRRAERVAERERDQKRKAHDDFERSEDG